MIGPDRGSYNGQMGQPTNRLMHKEQNAAKRLNQQMEAHLPHVDSEAKYQASNDPLEIV